MGRSEVKAVQPWFRRRIKYPAAMRPVAASLVARLEPGTVVTLSGDLGAGKTTFVRYACEALGIDPRQVRSPSFTLVNEYASTAKVYHIDLYRLGSRAEMAGLGLDDMLDEEAFYFIEWPGLASQGLARRGHPIVAIEIAIPGPSNERLLTVWPPANTK